MDPMSMKSTEKCDCFLLCSILSIIKFKGSLYKVIMNVEGNCFSLEL